MLVRVTGINEIGGINQIGRVSPLVHNAAKVTLLVGRGAFDLLVRLNVFGLATKLKAGIAKNPQAINDFWYKVGGDWDKLLDFVAKGSARNRILGNCNSFYRAVGMNGPARVGEPITLAALGSALVAATPIIIACLAVLQSLQVPTGDVPTGNYGNYAGQIYNAQGGTGSGSGSGGGYNYDPNAGGGTYGSNDGKILGMSPIQLGVLAAVAYLVLKK